MTYNEKEKKNTLIHELDREIQASESCQTILEKLMQAIKPTIPGEVDADTKRFHS